MEEEEVYEEYEEIPDDEDFTAGDFAFVGGTVLLGCAVVAFVTLVIKKTFKNIHLKIGNKIEIGIETKEEIKNETEKR